MKDELPIADLNDLIAARDSAISVVDYVLPNKQAKYVEQYGEPWGKNPSAEDRTQAIAGLMRVNLPQTLESSIQPFRLS